jgi:hypothetical protein
MGAGGSTLKGEEYFKKAEASKQLSDQILKIFFTRADFRDLLSLASLTSCSSYVFTTSEALQRLFTTLQVYPKLGKKGEILFAPVSKLAPGLLATKESDQEKRKAMDERNAVCMDVAYFYVRIFQIYAALALTVLDASPLRKRSLGSVGKASAGPQKGVFMGGAMGQMSQKGGALTERTAGYKQLKDTGVLAPFLEILELASEFNRSSDGKTIFIKTKEEKTFFYIELDYTNISTGVDVPCYYKYGNVLITDRLRFEKQLNNTITMIIEDQPVIQFTKTGNPVQPWVFRCIADNEDTINVDVFKRCIDRFFLPKVEAQVSSGATGLGAGGVIRPAGYTGASGTSGTFGRAGPGIALPTGASSFQSFDEIRKVFDKRFKGEDFPKAYCIARAMTLLNPLFDSELIDKSQPFYSQICSQKYDFELTDTMPRADRTPAANVYLKSLVALYYDDFTVKGSTVQFIQTETGRSSLRDASKKLALLYNIRDNQETFIESTQRFRHFGICPAGASAKLLQITKKEFVKKLQAEVIGPMLQFQEEHTKKVNELLKKMFLVDGKGDLRFQPALRNGGKAAVTEFSRMAAALLLNYYLKSEAYYIKGVLMFEDKANAGSYAFI